MHPDEKKAIAEKAKGDKAEETRLTQAACYEVQCWAEYSPNSDEYAANYVSPQQAAQLGPELQWVKSQSTSGGLFIYTLPQQWADSASSQTSMAVRGAQNLADQFATLMKRDAQGKIAESPSSLIIQGVANGLSAIAGWSGFEPPAGTAPVLVNSAGGQVTGAPTLGQPGYVPSNATLADGGNASDQPDPVLGGKSINDLSDAAKAPDPSDKSGELSGAGRALQKHGGRAGSAFPSAKGNPAAINDQGQQIVDSILNDPGRTVTQRDTGRFGNVIDITASDGRGVRYSTDGKFITLLEPNPK